MSASRHCRHSVMCRNCEYCYTQCQYHFTDTHDLLLRFLNLQIFTVPAIGAGLLQTSYGKEVPMYSPNSGSYPSP